MIRSFVDGPSQVHNSSIISRICKIIHSHIHNRKTLENKTKYFKLQQMMKGAGRELRERQERVKRELRES